MIAIVWRRLVGTLAFVLLPTVGLAQQVEVQFREVPRSTIESRLNRYGGKNDERSSSLKELFVDSGCESTLSLQAAKGAKSPNVICVLLGSSDSLIIVGAHFDRASVGSGVVDNWSGAAMLPSLFEGLKGQPRTHTFVFVGFTDEEKGLVGSSYYIKHLSPEQIRSIRAMVNLDSLGLGPTKIWLTRSDESLASRLYEIAKSLGLSLQGVNGDQVRDEDSTPFRRKKIRTVVLHSITQPTLTIVHSSKDNMAAIRMNDYYDTYRLIAIYLAYLDGANWGQADPQSK